MNKTLQVTAILATIFVVSSIVPVQATEYGDYSHAQGNGYQCATGVTQQMECQILNALKDMMPQIIQELKWQNGNLTQYIQLQNQIIAQQQEEINDLKSMIKTDPLPTTSVYGLTNCHKSGTGKICGTPIP